MATAVTGARVLGEIEETTLDEILTSLRSSAAALSLAGPDDAVDGNPGTGSNAAAPPPIRGDAASRRPAAYPIPGLDGLAARHERATGSALVAVSGRQAALVHTLVAALVSPPHSCAVVVVDVGGGGGGLRFDAARARQCGATAEDLAHAYVLRPPRTSGPPARVVADAAAAAERFVLYGRHASAAREWWGTVVVGVAAAASAAASSVRVAAGPRGWLRVDREDTPGFAAGTSVEEALSLRARRRAAVDASCWKAESVWGSFVFKEELDREGV